MTDLMPPPEDPAQLLRWARQVLREWSRPEYQGLLGREEILEGARQVIKAHQAHPLPPLPSRRPGRPRRQPP